MDMKDLNIIKKKKPTFSENAYEEIEGRYMEHHGHLPDAKRAFTMLAIEQHQCPLCDQKLSHYEAVEHMIKVHFPEDLEEFERVLKAKTPKDVATTLEDRR